LSLNYHNQTRTFHFAPTLEEPESAKPIEELAKPTTAASAALKVPESAKPTPTVLATSEMSSNDFTSTVVALVGMEVPEEKMVDYKATQKEKLMWLFCPPITTSSRMTQPQWYSTF
jgi:hypothetical protein